MNFVLGGNLKQGDRFIERHGLNKRDWRSLCDYNTPQAIEGLSMGTPIILTGDFYQTEVWRYIRDRGLDRVRFLLLKPLEE